MIIAHSLFSLRETSRLYLSQYATDIDGFCRKASMEEQQTIFINPRILAGTDAFLVA